MPFTRVKASALRYHTAKLTRDEIGQRRKDLALVQALIANGIEKASMFSDRPMSIPPV
jgi:hypothetical protein